MRPPQLRRKYPALHRGGAGSVCAASMRPPQLRRKYLCFDCVENGTDHRFNEAAAIAAEIPIIEMDLRMMVLRFNEAAAIAAEIHQFQL